ncbi:MAG: tetratricopeptide repeat protein [Blastocatellia bacterium]|nr:tetratricopeptide repeat protein [Blastocatellia bacterium]
MAGEQRKFEQAERYYKQALEIFIEYNDRYSQAGTYHQLGRVAEGQGQLQQARDYFLKALLIILEFEDAYTRDVILGSLARLWKATEDLSLPAAIAGILKGAPEEVEEALRKSGEGE